MTWHQALLAGVLQGLTEFLPISSSGHLLILNALFGGDAGSLAFTLLLHLATLVSVLIAFHKDVLALVRGLFVFVAAASKGRLDLLDPEHRFVLIAVIATIPAAVVGICIELLGLDSILENIYLAAVMLLVTAAFMFLADKQGKGVYTERNTPYASALLTGVFQACAILPGLSRSGSTIYGGLLGGLDKDFAVRFSFVLSIPTILGPALLKLPSAFKDASFNVNPLSLVIGFVAALICGLVSVKFVRLLIKGGRFYIFGIYCICASALAFWAA